MKLNPIPTNTVVHTPTEEEANELLAILHENGYKWYNGEPLDKTTKLAQAVNRTCYKLYKGKKAVTYSSKDWFEDHKETILTLAEFKRLYCEEEKPQPKFKVGDLVRIVNVPESDFNNCVGEVMFTTKKHVNIKFTDIGGWIEFLVDFVEPYTEPETKQTEDMETKQLNLLEILKGCENETFYSPCFGELTFLKTDCDSLLFITARGVSERFNLDGRLWIAVSTGMPILFPSRALYEQYPLDPYTAWMKWQEEQKYHIEVIVNNHDSNGDLTGCAYVSGDIDFRTPADRDKCIEEVKAIIEKYSKK